MSSRRWIRWIHAPAVFVGVFWAVGSVGQAADPQKAGESPVREVSAEEKAIQAFDQAYLAAYNRGDAKALAAMFTEDAEVFEADGARYRGRDLIERGFQETFAEQKGATLALEVESIRLLSPDVAKEEGRSTVTLAPAPPVVRFYTVLFVKRDGRWQITSVREEADPIVRPHDRLKELEWMIGEWIDEGSESHTRVQCRWSADGNFLLRDFVVKREGRDVLKVHQRVGWDPVAGEFRSWEFDSEGGFGEGHWSRAGDRWVVKQTGVRPEGVTGSSTRTLVRLRPNLVRWTLFDQVVAGEAIAGEETSVLTRVPPAPRLGTSNSNIQPGSPSKPQSERSAK